MDLDEVYNKIVELCKQEDRWYSQQEFIEYFQMSKSNTFYYDFHNSQERSLLTKIIRDINNSDKYEKIILSSSKGIKIANESDFKRILCKQLVATVNRLGRLKKCLKKANSNGQLMFDGFSVEDIKTIETFLR